MLRHPQTVYSYIKTELQLRIIDITFILCVFYHIIENREDLQGVQCRKRTLIKIIVAFGLLEDSAPVIA
jgi:hypothetical protein